MCIRDSSGGIAEQAGLDPSVRERTDALDALGNTTAATGKGFAIGSAALTALALMAAYANAVGLEAGIDILNFRTLTGALIGAMLPFVFSALTMTAVAKIAADKDVGHCFAQPAMWSMIAPGIGVMPTATPNAVAAPRPPRNFSHGGSI